MRMSTEIRTAFVVSPRQDAHSHTSSDQIARSHSSYESSSHVIKLNAHEYVFLLAKGQSRSRSIAFLDLQPERLHFSQYLVGAVAERLGRRWVSTDLSYQDLAAERTAQRGFKW